METLTSLDGASARLLDASMRGAIVLLAALVLTTLLRRRSAATRHAVWVGAVTIQLVLPLLGVWGPRWPVATPAPLQAFLRASVPPVAAPPASSIVRSEVAASTDVASNAPMATGSDAAAPSPTTQVSAGGGEASVQAATAIPPRALLLWIWAIGAAVVLLRLAVGTAVVASLARRGARVEDGQWLSLTQRLANSLRIQRPLILLRGTRIGVPVTWGIVYPVVLLPDDADSWPEERRRFVLVHEMAHVKRLDALTQLVGQVALAVFWFNPLMWIANRRMQLERENACDDYVLRSGTQPTQYAADLLEMVRSLGNPEHHSAQPAFAALAMARRSEFEGRMLSILDPVLDRHPLNRGRTMMSALATALLVVPLAALQPYRPAPLAAAPAADYAATPMPSVRVAATPAATPPASPTVPAAATASTSPAGRVATPPDTTAPAPVGDAMDQLLAADVARLNVAVKSRDARSRSLAFAPLRACDGSLSSGTSRTSIHMHTDDDPSESQLNYLNVTGDRCTQAMLAGLITYTPNEDDVVALSPSARFYLRERTGGEDRSVSIVRGDGGSLVRSYRRAGRDVPFDDDARRWLARILPTLLAETGQNARPRVARWRSEGGLDGVLRHLSALRSSGARRTHYEVLLDDRLPAAELEQVVRQAGRDLKGSSGDLRAVLTKAAPSMRASRRGAATLTDAISGIASSGDRTAVLELYGRTDDPQLLLAVMRMGESIPSSGDRTRLLIGLARRYLGNDDNVVRYQDGTTVAEIRNAFFATAATIPSSGDLTRVLHEATNHAVRSDAVALKVIETSKRVASSGDRSRVLVELANRRELSEPALRDAYLEAARGIPSSSDARRVLEALMRK